jgi:BASS family bile acid:Na+ symporter
MPKHFADYEYVLAAAQLVLVMLGMGATLRPADFRSVLLYPRGMVHGTLAQLVLVPIVAVVFARLFALPQPLAAGLLLIAAMPGGSLSNLFTFLAKGNVALSIALTATGTLASGVTVPLVLKIFGGGLLPSDFSVPLIYLVREVVVFLLIPLAGGMILRRLRPEWSEPFSRWCLRGGLVILAILIVGSIWSERIQAGAYGRGVPFVLILFCVVAQQLSMLPGRLLGYPVPDNAAVGIEITVRNINLALLLKAALFPEGDASNPLAEGVLFVILFYGATSLVVSVPMIVIHRWRAKRIAVHAGQASA